MISVLDQLASALGRHDERPNVELAETLAASGDKAAIVVLVSVLITAKTPIQNDAIKVLYEIGERRPELVAPHADAFLALLTSGSNRNVWGALTAIDTITPLAAKTIANHLDAILAAADKGSVIAKDKAVAILAKLAAVGFADNAVPILLATLKTAAVNQLPMYAETTAPVISPAHTAAFRAVLEKRLPGIPQPAKRARIEKVLRKLGA